MNFERILNMLLNQLMRQFVTRGIGAGVNALSRRKSGRGAGRSARDAYLKEEDLDDGLTPEDRAELARLKEKQAARRRRARR